MMRARLRHASVPRVRPRAGPPHTRSRARALRTALPSRGGSGAGCAAASTPLSPAAGRTRTYEEAAAILEQLGNSGLMRRDQMVPELLLDMRHYLERLRIDPDALSVIHVAGTKGEGRGPRGATANAKPLLCLCHHNGARGQ